jgi:hypothetical protein
LGHSGPMGQHRTAMAISLTVVGLALTAAVAWFGDGTSARPAVSTSGGESVETVAAEIPGLAVLRRWDERRARAYAAGDLAALGRLYVPHSRAGTADARLLRGYRRRGLRVVGMRMQVLAVDVRRHTRAVVRIRVTDRLADAVAVGHRRRVKLPEDRASAHVVMLRRSSGHGWRMVSVLDDRARPPVR